MNRVSSVCIASVVAIVPLVVLGPAATPACDPDNGGITLPTGFCAAVVADNLGEARHLVAAPNGDLFVSLNGSRGRGGVIALHDKDGDGKFEQREKFGETAATGLALPNGYLYAATPNSVVRWKMAPGELKPAGPAGAGEEGMASDGTAG